MRAGRRFLLLPLALSLVSCPPVHRLGRVPSHSGTSIIPAPLGARWVLHPRASIEPQACRRLADGRTLCWGPDGTRWLQDGRELRAAGDVLVANLVGAVDLGSDRVAFAGEDGTVLVTQGPLGAVEAVHPPPVALRSVSAGRSAFIGVDGEGMIVRIAGGGAPSATTFSLDFPVVQIAMREDGVGLALGAPGRVAFTVDDGASWLLAPTLLDGTRRVVVDGGRLVAEGLTSALAFAPAPTPHWQIIERFVPQPLRLPPFDVPANLRGAAAIRDGHGALTGREWIELAPTAPSEWTLYASDLGHVPVRHMLGAFRGCAEALFAVQGAAWSVACALQVDETSLRIYRSRDAGVTFQEGPVLGLGRKTALLGEPAGEVRLFALGSGALLLQDACAKTDASPCETSAKVLVVGESMQVVTTDRPALRLFGVRVARDGTVYAIGTEGTGVLYLLASRDGGASFSTVELPLFETCACSPMGENALLAAGADGEVAVFGYANAGRWLRYASVDHGAHVQVTLLPIHPDSIDTVGRRGLAYGPTTGWETADLGASWAPVAIPWSLQAESSHRALISCIAEGCLVDVDAVRLGWDLAERAAE